MSSICTHGEPSRPRWSALETERSACLELQFRYGGGGGGKTLVLTLAAVLLAALAWGLTGQVADAQSRGCTERELQASQSGITRSGSWSRSDCAPNRIGRTLWADHYTFRLDRESQVEIELSSADRTPLLILARADGSARVGIKGAQSAAMSRTLLAGVYRVEATKSDSGTGDYRLRLTAVPTTSVPPTLNEVRAQLARALFGPGKPTYHDYNSYGAQVPGLAGGCRGYDGGHSGWDAQTQSVAGAVPTRDEPFFSLTTGIVIRAGGGSSNTIAVYDATERVTTLYAHARRVDVRVDQTVRVGTQLGIQGNAGLSSDPTDREHVHVEVRRGRVPWLACGTTNAINPFDYLYRSVVAGG